MTLGTFQAVKFGGSKGGPGASRGGRGCHGAKAGATGRKRVRRGESGVPGVGGEPKRAGNIDHTAVTVNHSKARRTRQARSDEFASIPYWRNCTFT